MYLMYADESGDVGAYDQTVDEHHRSQPHYIVSAIMISDRNWKPYLNSFYDFRRYLSRKYGLPVRTELKGRELMYPTMEEYKKLGNRKRRVELYAETLSALPKLMPDAQVLSVHLNKANSQRAYISSPEGIHSRVWGCLLERFNTSLTKDCGDSFGMVIPDDGEEVLLRKLLRKMRVHNYAGSHFGGTYSAPLTNIIEDPMMRASHHSYYVQIADLLAHALFRKLYVRPSFRKYNVNYLYDKVRPIINLKASSKDPLQLGIVHC